MIKHALIVVKNAIEHHNSGQIPVVTMDQPLYAQIQWSWSELDEKSYVAMLGGLHIEMAVMSIMGKWLDGNGWYTALVEAGIATSGKAKAFLSASHVKCTCYAHQVTVACLHILLNNAYQSYCMESATPLNFEAWYSIKAQQHPQFYYWSVVMELERLLNMYVQSLHEGNFYLYIDMLHQLAPWSFVLDHVHYACWLLVHIRDMTALNNTHCKVYV